MAKIKLTIQELKRQKTAFKRFQRYLPTLTLKKIQLQIEINKVKSLLAKKLDEEKHLKNISFLLLTKCLPYMKLFDTQMHKPVLVNFFRS